MRIAVLILGTLLCAGLSAGELPAGAIQINADQIVWKEGPPSLPKGSKVAVLEGNPGKPGIFTLRVRAPAGARVAAHTHPKPERVTIISGAIGVGFGDYYDQTKLRVFRTGDYYLTPPGIPHFLSFAEDSVVQITGNGPWLVTPVSP